MHVSRANDAGSTRGLPNRLSSRRCRDCLLPEKRYRPGPLVRDSGGEKCALPQEKKTMPVGAVENLFCGFQGAVGAPLRPRLRQLPQPLRRSRAGPALREDVLSKTQADTCCSHSSEEGRQGLLSAFEGGSGARHEVQLECRADSVKIFFTTSRGCLTCKRWMPNPVWTGLRRGGPVGTAPAHRAEAGPKVMLRL